jgi:GTPase SAR1 family protein
MWSWLGVTSTSESMSSPLSVDNMLENNFDVEEPSTDIELKTRQKNIKIVLCGDPGGGKTSLIERYDTKKFRLDTKTTVGY